MKYNLHILLAEINLNGFADCLASLGTLERCPNDFSRACSTRSLAQTCDSHFVYTLIKDFKFKCLRSKLQDLYPNFTELV